MIMSGSRNRIIIVFATIAIINTCSRMDFVHVHGFTITSTNTCQSSTSLLLSETTRAIRRRKRRLCAFSAIVQQQKQTSHSPSTRTSLFLLPYYVQQQQQQEEEWYHSRQNRIHHDPMLYKRKLQITMPATTTTTSLAVSTIKNDSTNPIRSTGNGSDSVDSNTNSINQQKQIIQKQQPNQKLHFNLFTSTGYNLLQQQQNQKQKQKDHYQNQKQQQQQIPQKQQQPQSTSESVRTNYKFSSRSSNNSKQQKQIPMKQEVTKLAATTITTTSTSTSTSTKSKPTKKKKVGFLTALLGPLIGPYVREQIELNNLRIRLDKQEQRQKVLLQQYEQIQKQLVDIPQTTTTRKQKSIEPLAIEGNWHAYIANTDQLVFYYNTRTGQSQWNPPTSTFPTVRLDNDNDTNDNYDNKNLLQSMVPKQQQSQQQSQHQLLASSSTSSWDAYYDSTTGLIFYYNTVTGNSQWEKPVHALTNEPIEFPQMTSTKTLQSVVLTTPTPIYTGSDSWSAYVDYSNSNSKSNTNNTYDDVVTTSTSTTKVNGDKQQRQQQQQQHQESVSMSPPRVYYYNGQTGQSQWDKPYPSFPDITVTTDGKVTINKLNTLLSKISLM